MPIVLMEMQDRSSMNHQDRRSSPGPGPMRAKRIVMLGTRFDTMGGISAVVNIYRESGLFDRFPIEYIATHRDGSALAKISILLSAFVSFVLLLSKKQIALIHLHMSAGASFWRKSIFWIVAQLFCVRTIVHLHSGRFDRFYSDASPLARWLMRFIMERATRLIVLSEGWRDWAETTFRAARIEVLRNPVIFISEESSVVQECKVILSLGRLGQNKGTYDLIAALALLLRRNCPARLLLAGDGDEARARALSNELGVASAVELCGWVRGGAKAALLRRAALFALPSYSEGLPMSLLEAMAAGLPVIVSRVGGIPEVVSDGVEGFLIRPGDVESLADRMERLLLDTPLRVELGQNGRKRIEKEFSASVVIPNVERLYVELLSSTN